MQYAKLNYARTNPYHIHTCPSCTCNYHIEVRKNSFLQFSHPITCNFCNIFEDFKSVISILLIQVGYNCIYLNVRKI